MFTREIYVRVNRNRFRAKDIGSGREVQGLPKIPFSTARLLVGHYESGEQTLKSTLAELAAGSLLRSLAVVIHPLEMTEEGLSQVEERVFRELASGAGARKAVVWVGAELTDAEVSAKLKNA